MNYQHHFHAGNFADVHKHALLAAMFGVLCAKPKPITYIETHAGAGQYDLRDERAARSAESLHGIHTVLAELVNAPAPLQPYLKQINHVDDSIIYPGSPAIAAGLTRSDDVLHFCEREPAVAAMLKRHCSRDPRCRIHMADGYATLSSLLPPPIRRGLVLIDPPYESPDEFAIALDALSLILRRWPVAVIMWWYPIKQRVDIHPVHRALAGLDAKSVLVSELSVYAEESPARLNGSGMAVINAPFGFAEDAQLIGEYLMPRLARAPGASGAQRWLLAPP